MLDVVKHDYHPPTHFVGTGRLRIHKFPFVTAKTTDYNYYKQEIIAWEKHYTVTLLFILEIYCANYHHSVCVNTVS